MKNKLLLIVLIFSFCHLIPVKGQDGNLTIHNTVSSYLESISIMPIDSIISRCDILINSGKDVDQQGNLAGIIFNYFTTCPIMGTESVAVYIADNYFLNKKLPWPNESTYPNLFTYAEFNRESLIGKNTPELSVEDINGEKINILDLNGDYKILYFYESHCATCNKETPIISSFLENYTGEETLSFIAFYTQDNKEEWQEYVDNNFSHINNPKISITHLWDPEAESSFHKKYSVLTTPTLLLIDDANKIIGRKLNANVLIQIINQKNDYFSSLNVFLEGLLSEIETSSQESVDYIAEAFYNRTIHDPSLFRGTMSHIYNYLKSSNNYEFQKGAISLAEKYIIGMSELWPKRILDEAQHAIDAFNLNPLGELATDADLYTSLGCKKRLLSTKGEYKILFFHLVKCSDCIKYENALIDIMPIIKEKNAKIISIYVGPDKNEWKEHIREIPKEWIKLRTKGYGDKLYELYDIAFAPKIYILDKNNIVIAKDIKPETLLTFLESNSSGTPSEQQ